MNELTLDDKTYVSSKRAAEITGYAKDYVGQLCREGKIEARLVGRNWYILESAIREHRFGSEKTEEKSDRSYASSAWEAPRYLADAAPILPSLSERASINAFSDSAVSQNSGYSEARHAEPSTLLTDMQSAWQEWYERKETAPAAPEIIETLQEALSEPVDEEVFDTSEAVVEAAPALPTPETTLDLTRSYVNAYEIPEESEQMPEEEGTVIEEKVLRGVSATGITISASLIRSLMIAAMLLVVTVTIIGSGLLEQFVAGNSITRSTEIRYLAGVSYYNH